MPDYVKQLKELAEGAQSMQLSLTKKHTEAIYMDLASQEDMTDLHAMQIIFAIYMSCMSTFLTHRGDRLSEEKLEVIFRSMHVKELEFISLLRESSASILLGKGIKQ
jgi:hypothetical protein